MSASKIILSTALVVIGALVLVNAGQQRGGYHQSDGALTHYGGGSCHGRDCYSGARAQSYGQNGPYHSYAVRPAIYGGHGMYTYQGYARHPPAHPRHRAPMNYGSAPANYHAGGHHQSGYNRHQRPNYHQARPIVAIALIPARQRGSNYNRPSPSYNRPEPTNQQQQQSYDHRAPSHDNHGGHYRVARGAYGNGNGHRHGNGYGNGQAANYGNHHASSQRGYNGGNSYGG